MKQVIHIFGASGSGTSSLGEKLSKEFGYTLMDTDSYFWMPTEPPFTQIRPRQERVERMIQDIRLSENVVISGSLSDWGYDIFPFFTLAVRIEMEQSLRMERLIQREKAKYGSRIEAGGDMYEHHIAFMEWARAYDSGGMDMRSKALHDVIQKQFPCDVLCLNGADSLESHFKKVQSYLEAMKNAEP